MIKWWNIFLTFWLIWPTFINFQNAKIHLEGNNYHEMGSRLSLEFVLSNICDCDVFIFQWQTSQWNPSLSLHQTSWMMWSMLMNMHYWPGGHGFDTWLVEMPITLWFRWTLCQNGCQIEYLQDQEDQIQNTAKIHKLFLKTTNKSFFFKYRCCSSST